MLQEETWEKMSNVRVCNYRAGDLLSFPVGTLHVTSFVSILLCVSADKSLGADLALHMHRGVCVALVDRVCCSQVCAVV